MLNAFRHQRSSDQHKITIYLQSHSVLNAFRHQRSSDRLSPIVNHVARLCSTPFGIKEVRTWKNAPRLPFGRVCSTPFGIKEVRTFSDIEPSLNQQSAQRLSASKKFGRAYAAAKTFESGMCSTPFGIKEVRTLARQVSDGRYQRAQRLSASKKFGPPMSHDLRRHWQVLNAFRHQRSSDVGRQVDEDTKAQCSTPFGIKEVRTVERLAMPIWYKSAQRLSASKKFGHALRLDTKSVYRVLNAFRHQRSSDNVVPDPATQLEVCSTPFGIKEVRTARLSQNLCIFGVCSTPFGIKEVRTISNRTANVVKNVLNAFRHQRSSDQ